jgi:hypothetical protein
VELTIRHLSGSRAGETQVFNDGPIALGRNPTNQVAFDPNKDSVVSGNHAQLTFDGSSWKLRDLGSSNGTWFNGTKITERALMPGDVIQFGKNGPKLQFDFAGARVQPTMVVPLDSAAAAPTVPEGRTVMMMMDPAAAAAAGAPAGVAARPVARKKKGGMLKALLVIGALFMMLLIVVGVLATVVRRSNMKKKTAAVAAAKAEQDRTRVQAAALKQQIAAKQQEVAQTAASLDQARQNPATATSTAAGSQSADLQRQLEESQRLIEEMTRQLQEKNDALAAAQNKPARVEVRTIQVPTTRPPVRPTQVAQGRVSPPTTTEAPAVTPSNPPPGPTTSTRPSTTTPSTTTTSAPPPSAVIATGPLSKTKQLKTKILITSLPPEIPPANLPTGAMREVANALSTALVSSGQYVVGPKGQASVSIMITNYKSETKGSVDVKGTADSARRIGGLFGQKLPQTPGDVKSTAYDSAMSVRVALYDGNGRTLLQTEPSAASQDRKSKFSLAGVPFNQVVMSDTPTGDVARKVVGDAAEQILTKVTALDWTTTIVSQRQDGVTLGVGRSGNIEVGDVFEVTDGKRALGKIRVTSITESTSEAELLFAPGKDRLAGKNVRYLGSETPSSLQSGNRSVTIRSKTSAFDGPGNSFNTIRDLKPGQKFQLYFVVGPWGRVSDGSTRFWVPLTYAQINS